MPASTARWRRLVSMSPAEVRFRVRQHLQNRMEGLLHGLGVRFGTNALLVNAPAKSKAQFFFSPAELPAIVDLIKKRLPLEAEQIVKRAESICAHRFDLLGYRDLDFGADIDWQLDPVHGKRSPLKPWYNIPYLEYEVVGDSKIVWELNRHQHWVTLGLAFQLTAHEKYAEEFVRQFYHWRDRNPYPLGINWASSLEVAFRSLSWLWARELFAGSAAVTEDLQRDLLLALGTNAYHVERNLSTYFSRNTHLIGEAVALFFVGVLCPQLKDGSRWRALGAKVLLEEAQFQVREDGGYFEQSTYYHVYALDFLLHARLLAARNQFAELLQVDSIILAMLEHLAALAQGGPPPRFGDDDGGRLFDPQRNQTQHLLDPLSTGAVLFGRGDFKALAGTLRQETLWLLGPSAAKEFDHLSAVPVEDHSHSFLETGLYLLAGCGVRLAMDAGPMGVRQGGHGHADALSVTVAADGFEWLEDTGTYTYSGWTDWRNRFRGTAAHNTLTIEGHDQAQPMGPFAWSALPETRVEHWIKGKTFDVLVASHAGYERLKSPARHRRAVFFVKPHFWLIVDHVEGSGEHVLEINWHLAAVECELNHDAAVLSAHEKSFAIVSALDPHWRVQLVDGWASVNYGTKQPAKTIRNSATLVLPADTATVLVPHADEQEIGALERVRSVQGSPHLSAYRYATGSEEHIWVFAWAEGVWKLDQFSSDARIFYCARNAAGMRHVVLCDGSFVAVDGENILAALRLCPYVEWVRSERGRELYCPDGVKVRADIGANSTTEMIESSKVDSLAGE